MKNDTWSSRSKILFRLPQGSIIGPWLSKRLICDLYVFVSNSDLYYPDDKVSYSTKRLTMSVLNNFY